MALGHELLTLHEVRKPSTPAYICLPDYQYTAAERVFRMSYQSRAASLGFWDARTMASLNNWITTLIKLKKYGKAAKVCRRSLDTLQNRDDLSHFIIMKCNLAACLVLSKQKEESDKVLDYLRQRHMFVPFDNAAEAYFEALSMTCRTGSDCMVLRDSDDRAPGVVRIYDYPTQAADPVTSELEGKTILDQGNLICRSVNMFSVKLAKCINSHKVQRFLHPLRRTASLLLRSSQIHRLSSITVILETDAPQEVDARLVSSMASPSPANRRKSLAALVEAFEFGVDHRAIEQQCAEISTRIVDLDIPTPPMTQPTPESQVFRANSKPPSDQKLLESRGSQVAPKPGATEMSASGSSHTPPHRRMEGTLKSRFDAPMFVQRHEQQNKEIVSSTTVNISQESQGIHGSSMVEAWLEYQKANPPIPDMFPIDGTSSSPADAMIRLTYRTIDTVGSSQVADINPENLLPVTAWAGCRTAQVHNPKQIKVLLDDGASKNCVSEEFCEAINAQIDTERTVDLKGPDGKRLQVLGRVTVAFSWEGPSGTKIKKIPCYVVEELEIAMLICHAYILKLELRGSPAMQAPILSSITKQERLDNEKKSRDIGAAAKVLVSQEKARRKAARQELENSHPGTPNTMSSGTTGSLSSLIGGSDTTAPPRSSSTTGFTSSITGDSTPQSSVSSPFSQ